MKTKPIIFIWLMLLPCALVAQGSLGLAGSRRVVGGRGPGPSCTLCGGSQLHSNGQLTDTSSIQLEFDFGCNGVSISDSLGNLLMVSNGRYLLDGQGQMVPGGDSLAPTFYGLLHPFSNWQQSSLLLPYGLSPGRFALLNTSPTTGLNSEFSSPNFWFTEVVQQPNGALSLLHKNRLVYTDSLEKAGTLTACRHANGRDWWVLAKRKGRETMFTYLLTPDSLLKAEVAAPGVTKRPGISGNVFSNDGSWFASYTNLEYGDTSYLRGSLKLYRFDRCTGALSLAAKIPDMQMGQWIGLGVCFSPNDAYVYFCNFQRIWRLNLNGPLDSAHVEQVAEFTAVNDSTASGQPFFTFIEPSNDGRLFVSFLCSTRFMSVIEHPDAPMVGDVGYQHYTFQIPYFNNATYTNHPWYTLGPVVGSVCDSLGLVTGKVEPRNLGLAALPNPAWGLGGTLLRYSTLLEPALMQVLSLQGQVLHEEPLNPGSTEHSITNGPLLAPGVYVLRVFTQTGSESRVKWIITQRP